MRRRSPQDQSALGSSAARLADEVLESLGNLRWVVAAGEVVVEGMDLEAELVAAGLAGSADRVAEAAAALAASATEAGRYMSLRDGADITAQVLAGARLVGSGDEAVAAVRDPLVLWSAMALDYRLAGIVGSGPNDSFSWRGLAWGVVGVAAGIPVVISVGGALGYVACFIWAFLVTALCPGGPILSRRTRLRVSRNLRYEVVSRPLSGPPRFWGDRLPLPVGVTAARPPWDLGVLGCQDGP